MTKIAVTLYGKEGEAQYEYAPATEAAQVAMAAADGNGSDVAAEIVTLREQFAAFANSGVVFKGALTSTTGLPTVGYKAGWQYVVQDAGTYAGNACEVGDFVICIKSWASGSASNADWAVLQVNIVGAVTGPASAVANRVAAFDGTSGKIIKDSGYSIGKSVPADAVFTDTTYAEATSTGAGLMSAADKAKLNGIEAAADVTDAANVAAAGAFMKASDTANDITDGTTKVLMTTSERTKLASVTAGAEPNQNAFSVIKVGTTNIAADSKTDTLELAAGSGITLTPDASGDKVTMAETYVDSCIVTSLSSVPSNLRNGGMIVLKS